MTNSSNRFFCPKTKDSSFTIKLVQGKYRTARKRRCPSTSVILNKSAVKIGEKKSSHKENKSFNFISEKQERKQRMCSYFVDIKKKKSGCGGGMRTYRGLTFESWSPMFPFASVPESAGAGVLESWCSRPGLKWLFLACEVAKPHRRDDHQLDPPAEASTELISQTAPGGAQVMVMENLEAESSPAYTFQLKSPDSQTEKTETSLPISLELIAQHVWISLWITPAWDLQPQSKRHIV